MVIGLDLDGVIIDYIQSVLPLLSGACGRPIKYEDVTHPSVTELLDVLDIDEVSAAEIWRQILGTDLLQKVPPVKGAIEGLTNLSQHKKWIITGRPKSLRNITVTWLDEKGIQYDCIRFDSGKMTGDLTLEKQCDVFVEDELQVANFLAEQGVFTLLFNQPWNQSAFLPEECKRVYNWNEVLKEILEIETRRKGVS